MGQVRKYNGAPYITHPIRVAGRVATHPMATECMVAAAFLHDVVEDCGVSFSEIEFKFGKDVAACVEHLTNIFTVQNTGKPRDDRKRLEAERIAMIPVGCKIIKLIDHIDNLREMDRCSGFGRTYCRESLLLAESLKDADGDLYMELVMLCKSRCD